MARRFQLHAVIGKGSGTTVYRASELGKDVPVAMKMLDSRTPAREVLVRMRDEARILSSLRGVPGFVEAELPVQLEGHWVVVQEFVRGNTAFSLLRHGAFPAAVAASVVAAAAAAMARAWEHAGPKGPLRLLHHDLKPGNLLVTELGEVRVLDLGVASAAIPGRETATRSGVAGTAGYLAPERSRGENLPAGDVFALGVVLNVLLTGVHPERRSGEVGVAPPESALTSLAGAMQAPAPEDRPTMEEVADRANRLAAGLAAPGLRVWAQTNVRPAEGRDARCGEVWAEDPWWRRWVSAHG